MDSPAQVYPSPRNEGLRTIIQVRSGRPGVDSCLEASFSLQGVYRRYVEGSVQRRTHQEGVAFAQAGGREVGVLCNGVNQEATHGEGGRIIYKPAPQYKAALPWPGVYSLPN